MCIAIAPLDVGAQKCAGSNAILDEPLVGLQLPRKFDTHAGIFGIVCYSDNVFFTDRFTDMISKPIYELLPYLYALGGLIAIVSIDNIFGKLCGVVLIVTAIIVHQVRARFRSKKPVPLENSGRDPKSGRPAAKSGGDPRSGRLVASAGREPVSRRAMPDQPSRRR